MVSLAQNYKLWGQSQVDWSTAGGERLPPSNAMQSTMGLAPHTTPGLDQG